MMRIEDRKKEFEFVREYENFDLYRHKKAKYYECFDK